jgi:hypothetical protein
MADKKLFVSHAAADLETVSELVGPIYNLPIGVHVAGEEIEPGHSRRDLTGRLANSDLLLVLLTEAGADDHWVNQELGYATARDVPILPVVEADAYQKGYANGIESIEFDPDSLKITVFNLLCRLRSTLAPVGQLSKPGWYIEFPCGTNGCGTVVTLDIEQRQKSLWQQYKHGNALAATCPSCSVQYQFNPATLGFIGRQEP